MPHLKKEREYYPPRLMDTLSGMMDYHLTAVCAPSGAGKTSAVRAFFSHTWKPALRLLWYTSFGETPDAGWNRVCDLFAKVDGEVAEGMRSLGFPTRQTLSLLAEVIQDFQCDEETVLVIDNAQLFGSETPYELMGVLAMHQCDNFHIIVITQNPLDELARVISTPGILFIGAQSFFFTVEEIAAYFNLNGAELAKSDLRQVMDNTNGWIAALRLQLLGYQKNGVIQKETDINQLIYAVVWRPLWQEEQYFLIAFSEVGYATMAQICTLVGCETMPEYGRRLLDRGEFITYDAEANHYIMHQILREYAQSRLEELPKDEQRVLHVRAGHVYAEAGLRFLAVRCMFKARDYESLLKIPLKNADMAEYGSEEIVALLSDILDNCPAEVLELFPWQLLRFAFELVIRGENDLYAKTCALLHKSLRPDGVEDADMRRKIRGEYIFLRSFEAFNDLAKMNVAHKSALKVLGGPSKAFDARGYWTFGVPSILTPCWGMDSSQASLLRFFEQKMPDYLAITNGHGIGAVELMQAEAYLHAGNLNAAEVLCNQAVFLAENQYEDTTVYFGAQLTLGRIAILQGNTGGYCAALDHIHDRSVVGTEKARHAAAGQCTAHLESTLGRLENIPEWLTNAVEINNHVYKNGICYAMHLYAKQLMIKQEYKQLLGFAEPMLENARQQNSALLVIYYHIYLACALQAAHALSAAEEHLRAALRLALPNHVYLPFAENLEALDAVLAVTFIPEKHAQQIARIRKMSQKQRTGIAIIRKALLAVQSGLTKRENEVVILAKNGLTNKEIGVALGISPETVKAALKSIFSKSGIHSRRELHRLLVKLPP